VPARFGPQHMPADVRRRLLLWALVGALIAIATGCGNHQAAMIRIGGLADCEGLFSPLYEETLAGFELPLLERGAKLRGARPSDGVRDASVAGKRVELVFGCLREFSRSSTLAELRRLVEQEHVDMVVGPSGPADGLVVRDYAKHHPGVTFVYAGFDEASTLQDPAPNLFRFRVTMAQWGAGLGAYAYRELGWRRAVTVGQDGAPTWSGVSGFIAEFCSLGGNVVQRLWLQGDDFRPLVAKIQAKGVDGVFLPTSLYGTEGFITAWSARHHRLARSLVAGDVVFTQNPTDRRLLGVVAANPTPWVTTRGWTEYTTAFAQAFRGIKAEPANALDSFDAMEPALEALAQVHGDLAHGERRLMAALARLRFESPEGERRLDAHHQAIGTIYLGRMATSRTGKLVVRQIRVVPNVDETFGGYLEGGSAVASRSQPLCKHGHPPSWARYPVR
jgi:branched-chain amino acid transport system substrate-binding protein